MTRLAWLLLLVPLGADDAESAFKSKVQPILQASCMKCHGAEKPKGKLNLAAPFSAEPKLWFRVLEQVESGSMPPDGEKPLSEADRKAITGWVRGDLTETLAARQAREGRSRLRRLSRAEYSDTILDLFGFRPPVGRELPADGRVDGYTKVAGALPMSSTGAAGYVQMTEDILRRVLRPVGPAKTIRAVARESEQSKGHILELGDGTFVSFNSDTTSGPLNGFSARVPGMHHLKLSVYAYQTDKPLPFGIYAGHTGAYPQLIDLVKVLEAPPGKPTVIETDVYFRTGDLNDTAPVSDSFRLIPFGLGVPVPKNTQAKNCKGPGLAVQWVDVVEPEQPLAGDRWLAADFSPLLLDEMRRGNVTLQKAAPKGAAKSTSREEFMAAMQVSFKRIGLRLYRRELTSAELTELLTSISRQLDAGDSITAAFLNQVALLMTSPDFLCILEKPGTLPDHALATRLSYFLWNSAPDEALLDAAKQGRLRDPKGLRDQTERLLKDPKSSRFVNEFVDQWLGLRAINDTTPDGKLYPEYDDLLKVSSVMETQATFRRILTDNLSVREFVAPNWALVNERLARHYGLPEVPGLDLKKVPLPADSPFGGLWTQSAVLKVTANGTNTSPVKRGVWVSERLLGIRIPPPPPNVSPVEPDVRGAKTLREQLALHRGNGSCASCHARFDPYGFALESFDVTGSYRQHYREPSSGGARSWKDGLPVDCSGTAPDGRTFSGIRELREQLAKRPEAIARGVARHLVTYATGAPAGTMDEPAIDRIVKAAAADDFGLRSLLHAVVQSELFRSK